MTSAPAMPEPDAPQISLSLMAHGLDLEATLTSGQAFSWKRTADGRWRGWIDRRPCLVWADGDALRAVGPGLTRDAVSSYFALDLPDVGRFRGNAHFSRGGPEAVFRHIKTVVPDLETLGHRPSLTELCKREEGLIILTGMTGAGKTTTMASMVQRISSVRSGVIITIEDPIEYLLPDNLCIVKQREVGTDTKSFANGLRQILKQDPDVIVVGEMGDRETMQVALSAAETGHLVIGTLHTIDAPNSIHRILDFFPGVQQNQIVTQLASCLVAVVSQRLLPRADGNGRVIATETMIANPGIRVCIRDRKVHIIPGLMEIGSQEGMNTLDESLAQLVKSNLITYEEAIIHARDRDRIPSQPKPSAKKKKKGFFS